MKNRFNFLSVFAFLAFLGLSGACSASASGQDVDGSSSLSAIRSQASLGTRDMAFTPEFLAIEETEERSSLRKLFESGPAEVPLLRVVIPSFTAVICAHPVARRLPRTSLAFLGTLRI